MGKKKEKIFFLESVDKFGPMWYNITMEGARPQEKKEERKMTIEQTIFEIHMKDYWTEEDKKFLNEHRDVSIYPKRDPKITEEINRQVEEKYLARMQKREEAKKKLEEGRAEREKMLADILAKCGLTYKG